MKDSVIFYYEWLPLIANLPNASKLKLYEIILNPDFRDNKIIDDPHLKGVVDFIKIKISQNESKYEKVIETRRLSGAKGGKQKVANASKTKQKVANVADNVNANANENVNERANSSLKLYEFCLLSFKEEDKQAFMEKPDECIPDKFGDEWFNRKGKDPDKMFEAWGKFYRFYTSADNKYPMRNDWETMWINWLTNERIYAVQKKR